jgi:hypothetical protein
VADCRLPALRSMSHATALAEALTRHPAPVARIGVILRISVAETSKGSPDSLRPSALLALRTASRLLVTVRVISFKGGDS